MADQTQSPGGKRGLFAELSHRHVWRAAAVYIGAVWALSQGMAQLGPFFGAPDWAVRWFVIGCGIGFPFWIALAWYYKLTPEGIKRESEVTDDDPALRRAAGRRLDFWIVSVLAVAVVLLATNTFVLRRDATSLANRADADAVAAKLAKVPGKSVAVLPFANESGDPGQDYFSDGLAEELITDLTQIPDLKVIGKYSSFKFRNSGDSPAQIGATLGVAHLIEGSVRTAGGALRVTVTLIRAADGSSVWSHRYDRPLKDVFAIQTEIGNAVADALKTKLAGGTLVDQQQPPDGNVKAYQLMLQGRAQARRQTKADYEQGIALLEKAVQLDPAYAYAWAVLANARLVFGTSFADDDARQPAIAGARSALDRATALAPDATLVHLVRAQLLSTVDADQAGALAEMQQALASAPHDGTAMAFLAWQLAQMGRPAQAVDLYRQAIATDPLRADWYASLSYSLAQLGRFAEAEQAARTALDMQANPYNYLQLASVLDSRGRTDEAVRSVNKALALQQDYPGARAQLVLLDIRRHDPVAALRDAEKETDPDSKALAQAAAKQIGADRAAADAALAEYIQKYRKTNPFGIAQLYALRNQPDEMFKWLETGVAMHDYATTTSLLPDTLLQPYHHDPRFVALCRKLGLPVPALPAPSTTS